MTSTLQKVILQMTDLLRKISPSSFYTQAVPSLGNATVGQHTRHIIEYCQQLISGYETGVICYDDRIRDNKIETDLHQALYEFEKINSGLMRPDKPLKLFVKNSGDHFSISTTYFREVYYNFEHCIHHQALIRVALHELNLKIISADFGIAPATLEYREKCVQ
jgi:hypothetical protein